MLVLLLCFRSLSALAGLILLFVQLAPFWFVFVPAGGNCFALGTGGIRWSLLVGGLGPVLSIPKLCFKPFRTFRLPKGSEWTTWSERTEAAGPSGGEDAQGFLVTEPRRRRRGSSRSDTQLLKQVPSCADAKAVLFLRVSKLRGPCGGLHHHCHLHASDHPVGKIPRLQA